MKTDAVDATGAVARFRGRADLVPPDGEEPLVACPKAGAEARPSRAATDVVWHVSEELPVNVRALGRENLRQVSHLHRDSVRGWSPPGTAWLRSPTLLASVAVGIVTLVLRLAYGATAPTDAAGAQLVIGSSRFDVAHGAPPAPGSWLYVAAGHAVHVVTGWSTVHSLVLLAALASAGAVALTCVVGTAFGGRWVGIAAAALVASAPVSWFAGSTVSAYGFVALVGALLVVLARRARPYRAHGVVAVLVLGLGAGVRLSVAPRLRPSRRHRRGGERAHGRPTPRRRRRRRWRAWRRGSSPSSSSNRGAARVAARRARAFSDAAHASSVFAAPASGAATNIGTFGGWSVVSLGPVIVVGVLAVLALAGARLVTRHPAGNVARRIWNTSGERTDRIERPFYQHTGAIFGAAVVPPLALVTLGRFADGGDVMWYLAPVTVLMCLPAGRLLHHRTPGVRHGAAVVATVLVAGIVAVNIERFVAAPGILPASVAHDHPGLWLSQPRYQAPYADTAATISAGDRAALSLGRLRTLADPATDLIVCGPSPAAVAVYRIVGEVLPQFRVALVGPGLFTELGGLVYRYRSSTLLVGPGGHAYFLVPGHSPEMTVLASRHEATETAAAAGFFVWRVAPGATVFGVTTAATAGPRPL